MAWPLQQNPRSFHDTRSSGNLGSAEVGTFRTDTRYLPQRPGSEDKQFTEGKLNFFAGPGPPAFRFGSDQYRILHGDQAVPAGAWSFFKPCVLQAEPIQGGKHDEQEVLHCRNADVRRTGIHQHWPSPAALDDARLQTDLSRSQFFRGHQNAGFRRAMDGSLGAGCLGRAEDFLGYVFLKSQVYEGKSIAVLVGVASTGLITSVRVKGSENIEEEFLAQFRGKSVRGNFNLVRAPEDLLPVPAGIRLMPDKADLSESITFALREIAQAAGEVIR